MSTERKPASGPEEWEETSWVKPPTLSDNVSKAIKQFVEKVKKALKFA